MSTKWNGVACLYFRRAAKFRILAAGGLLSVKRTGVACLSLRKAARIIAARGLLSVKQIVMACVKQIGVACLYNSPTRSTARGGRRTCNL